MSDGEVSFTENVTLVSAGAVNRAAGQFYFGFLQVWFRSRASNLTEFHLGEVRGHRRVSGCRGRRFKAAVF